MIQHRHRLGGRALRRAAAAGAVLAHDHDDR